MAKTTKHGRQGPSRRTLLKGAAAAAGVVAGTKALGGFPTVWAQDTKDIVINHSGMSYSTIIQIAEQATVDLPFSVEMSVTDHAGMLNRLTTQSDSIDVAD
ncbi:MAG: twin-arginine translocation signal domain-containing protein, partial [Rhodospirillales bacterium]|nr:twin-arginine translocation signal domain-containing protein [Rhodospirillales bacterium]MDE0379933.1 twin-arginine translocation signal domain-containing protein [Rhodospirillales bacterium]